MVQVQPYVVPPSQSFGGDDGSWSSFNIAVGTPAQDFQVFVSTAASSTWVVLPAGCQHVEVNDCPQLRGVEPFQGLQSTGFNYNQSSTWQNLGLYDLELEQNLNYTDNALYGYDTVQLGASQSTGSLVLNKTLVAGIAAKDLTLLGQLGLGIQPTSFSSETTPVPTLMEELKNKSMIPSLSYGYTAGAFYQGKQVEGSLILGGYDSSRFNNSGTTFSFDSNNARGLSLGVQSIITSNSLSGSLTSFTTEGFLALIDSTVAQLWLPEDVCDAIQQAFGLRYDPSTELYTVNNTIHTQLQQMNPTLTFKIGNSVSGGNFTNINIPYAAFDLQASWPIYQNATNYFPIRRATNSTQYTIGRTFLQEAYLIVDYERGNFSVNQATFPDSQASPTIVPITSVDGSGSETIIHFSGGAIAGIVIGAIALLAIIGGVIFYFLRRRRERRRRDHGASKTHLLDPSIPPNSLGSPGYVSDLATPASTYMSLGGRGVYAPDGKYSELGGAQVHELDGPLQQKMMTSQQFALKSHGFNQDDFEAYEMDGRPVQKMMTNQQFAMKSHGFNKEDFETHELAAP